MAICTKIRKKNRQVCAGDLVDYGTINTRDIAAPISGGVDFEEVFTLKVNSFMLVETVRGESLFDQVGVEQDVTHHVYIPYISGLTFQDWIDIEGQRFNVIDVEDLDNRHDFQLCRCTNRGLATKAATHA